MHLVAYYVAHCQTDNPTRDALRKILCQALCTDGPHDAAPAVAAGIETGVFEKVGYPNGKSKIKYVRNKVPPKTLELSR